LPINALNTSPEQYVPAGLFVFWHGFPTAD